MIKKQRKYKKRLIYAYLSLIISVVVFLIIYAYRFDVMDMLVKNEYINFELNEQEVSNVQKQFKDYELNNKNMDIFANILKNELPNYSYNIVSYPNQQEQENDVSLQEGSIEEAEEGVFYIYGQAANKQSSLYAQMIEAKCKNASAVISLFPNFTEYYTFYRGVAFTISLILFLTSYLLLSKQILVRIFTKLYRKIIGTRKTIFIKRLSTKIVILNSLAVLIAFLFFTFTFTNRYAFFEFMMDTFYQWEDYDEYISEVRRNAQDLVMDKTNKSAIGKLLNYGNYDNIESYLYKENSLYYTSSGQKQINDKFYRTDSNIYSVSAITTPLIHTYSVDFLDQTGLLIVYSYPLVYLANPYQFTLLAVAFSFYLLILLYFIQMKIHTITIMQEDVSVLANGDWNHEVIVRGNDELAELGNHLNQMRISFVENMENENAARTANKDLISAMSHDLRTPLTTLNGYLEIIQLEKGDKDKRDEYIARCLNKVEEIRDLSNKMFEYSLVYYSEDNADMQLIRLLEVNECLSDHIQYLKILGFVIQEEFTKTELSIYGNWGMLKRMFNNLFSNIQKYAVKGKLVSVALSVEKSQMKLVLFNFKNKTNNPIESNGVGLKSVHKIVAIHKGECYINDNENDFMIVITLPIDGGYTHAT